MTDGPSSSPDPMYSYSPPPPPPAPPAAGGAASPPATAVAGFGTRVGAYLVDVGVILAAAIAVSVVNAVLSTLHLGFLGNLLFFALWLAAIAYGPFFNGVYGQTIGKRILHIRVVDQATGQPIGLGRGVVRYLVLWVTCIPLYIGLFSPLFDGSGRQQGWHDKVAEDLVVPGDSSVWPPALSFLKPA